MNSKTKVEQTAEFVANVVKNNTKNGKYAALLVEPNEKTDKNLIDTNLELYNLYGVFRENIASYVSTVNADHQYDVRFKSISTNNLSYVYVTSGFNTVPYHGHFKHEYYPLELMFKRDKLNPSFNSLIYISQSQADKFLDLDGLEHSTENYQSLLNTKVVLRTNGVEKEWQIEDIYLEQNYFYDAVTECAGEFVFAWSSDAFLKGPKKQSLYFLSSYSFRNLFYFDYATSLYPQSDFDYKVSDYNFIDGYKIDTSRLVFSTNSHDQIGSFLVLSFGILLDVSNLIAVYFLLPNIKWWYHIAFGISTITPYLVFKLIYLMTGNIALFSSFATTANMIMLLSTIFLYVIIVLLKKRKRNAVD
ncbi:MAG: hypothetical protein K5765_03690 [Clostridia bacterium]|nr:hypothetical protein [Clostridia bacterium]